MKEDFYLDKILADPDYYGLELKKADWPTVYRLKPLDSQGLDLEAIRKQMAWSNEYGWAIYWCYRRFW